MCLLIDPQTASATTDFAGLATGSDIRALATVGILKLCNIYPSAHIDSVDAGDPGIRASSVSSPSLGGPVAVASSGVATHTVTAKPLGGE